MTVAVLCLSKRGLFKCQAEAVGVCQYCGRPFCRAHSDLLEDGQEVCNRRFCVAKRKDLAQHMLYKARVSERNAAGDCGVDGCRTGRIDGACARCRGLFCGQHVAGRQEIVMHNGVRLPVNSTLCRHCWARRPIWTRV